MLKKLQFILFFSLLLISEYVMGQTTRPRLIVGIMIDGFQAQHLEKIWNNLQQNGIKRFVNEGVTFTDMRYNFISGGNASDIAGVMTGTVPFNNGITGNYRFDRATGNVESALHDENETGIGTKAKYSAHHLLSSTFTDELKLAGGGKSKVYAVAVNPESAVMMGGHTANSVAWIDDVNLRWVTTGYYTEGLSRSADEMNVSGNFRKLAMRKWEPLFPLNFYYSGKSQTNRNGNFSYNPTDRISTRLPETLLKRTPAANSLVTELARLIIDSENLGYDNEPDVLMLQYTVKTPKERINSLETNEKEDIYYRFDREIQLLLEHTDRKTGNGNVLFFLFSNQTDPYSPNELGENRIPAGYFSANRSMALLNTYLMAIYGQEKWVEGYFAKNIYLNRNLIAARKINLNEIRKNVIDFMLEFEGVQAAFGSSELFTLAGDENSASMKTRNSVHKNTLGDVTINLMPGWLEFDEKYGFAGESSAVVSRAPFYMFGWKTKPQTLKSMFFVTDIAPTISDLLKIPFPNASTGKVIQEINL